MERLIFFDIDGTLTRTQNGFVPFNQAIMDTFNIAADIRSVFPDGMTDPHILEEIFAKMEAEIAISGGQLIQFADHLRRNYATALENGTATVRALAGVTELLERLSVDKKFVQGVVTGNFEATARMKLEAAGLACRLSFGAYAGDSSHRPDLPPIARRRWEKNAGRAMRSDSCVIVGDTPKDLEAARANGMKCVLVGTGRHPIEELRYLAPDAAITDLTDTEAVIDLLGKI
jgi:phosphoglycolate phosphatase-like HAD superfamily hydrolase